MKLLSYDIEIYDELIDGNGEKDFSKIRPSVAAICTDEHDVQYFEDDPYMSKETAVKLVNSIMNYHKQGIVSLTWNGLSFDYALLGQYSGMIEECGELALNHYDMMLWVTFRKGFYLGLDKALTGAKLETKRHVVKLNDGTELTDMSGAKAPELWRMKEFSAVKYYLEGDVIQPLKLVDAIQKNNGIRWFSNTGKLNFCNTKMETVKELFKLPVPDTSWMTNPPKSRKEFVSWIPKNVLEHNGLFL